MSTFTTAWVFELQLTQLQDNDRLYYLNGKLVKWVDGRNSSVPFNTRAARKTDQFVRKDAAAFSSRLGGCPANLIAVADTAAPAMAPAPADYDTGMKVVDDVREKGYVAAMKQDLRNLATYEEQFAADNGGGYFSGQASPRSPVHGFSPSNYVTIRIAATRGRAVRDAGFA